MENAKRELFKKLALVVRGTLESRMVGFFSELPIEFSAPLLRPNLKELISDEPQDSEEKIVEYLECGKPFIGCPGLIFDPFSLVDIAGSQSLLTDEIWIWPAALSYFVNKYHVRLPAEFTAHMEKNGWKVK